MANTLIVGLGGAGDLIESFQCAHYAKLVGDNVVVKCLARNETFQMINYLFNKDFEIQQESESVAENYKIITDDTWINEQLKHHDYVYVTCPDLLFRSKYAFPAQSYRTTPKTIKQTRLLTKYWTPHQKISLCLNSNTEGYLYEWIFELAKDLALNLPSHIIYLPILNEWANKKINHKPIPDFPPNVCVDHNPNVLDAIEHLKTSEYAVVADNGFFHIANQFGVPLTLLDPRFGYSQQSIGWHPRWRPFGMNDSLDINTPPRIAAEVVKINLTIPETQLIPRFVLAQNLNVDWKQSLILKF